MYTKKKNKARTDKKNIFRVVKAELCVRIDIGPQDVAHYDDLFTLFSTDPSRTYEKTLTVKNDCVDGDEYIDLIYEDLKPDLKYSFVVDEGEDGERYVLFENLPYDQLLGIDH